MHHGLNLRESITLIAGVLGPKGTHMQGNHTQNRLGVEQTNGCHVRTEIVMK
jgi:hypothetical protein